MTHYDLLSELNAVIDISDSPEGTYTILDLPTSHPEAATSSAEILKKKGYMFCFLTGIDNPDNVAYRLGAMPHPDAATLELLSRETGLPMRTPEQRAQALGFVSLNEVA